MNYIRVACAKILEFKWVIVVCLAAIFLHCFRISSLPWGLHVDEIGMAYDAWSLANYGVDRHLNSWPVYLINYGGGQSALYAYLCTPLFKMFGVSILTIRIPSIIFSLLTLYFGLKIVWLIWKDKVALLIFALVYSVSPYFLMAGRLGLDCNLMLGMSTIFLYFYIRAVKKQSYLSFLLAGIASGLTLYTYAISYFIMPLFLLFSLIYLLCYKKITIRKILVLGLPIFVLALPLIMVQYININGLESIKLGIFTIPRLPMYRASEIKLPTWEGLLVTLKSVFMYDWLDYNSLPKYWNLYPVSIPFCVLGILMSIKSVMCKIRKEWRSEALILMWLLLVLLVGTMMGEGGSSGANANKLNAAFFAVLFFVTCGIYWLYGMRKKFTKVILILTTIIYFLCTISFMRYYFWTQPQEKKVNHLFAHTMEDVFAYIEGNDILNNKIVYIGRAYELKTNFFYSLRFNPYRMDMTIGSYGRYVFGYPTEVNEDACYVALRSDYEEGSFEDNLLENGFVMTELDGVLLFYK